MSSKSLMGNNSGIARRLTISIFLFIVIATLIASTFQLYHYYKNSVSQVQNEIQLTIDSNLDALTDALWIGNQQNIQLHLNGLTNLPDIQYLEVRDQQKIWATAGILKDDNTITRTVKMQREFREQLIEIGEFTIVASLAGVYNHVINQAIIIFISNGIIISLVAGFILILFRKLVTRHLLHIANSIKSRDVDNLGSKIELDRLPSKKEDELDTVVNAINQMGENLYHSVSALKESEAKVRLLLNSTEEAIIGIDLDGNCIFVNQACINILGYLSSDDLTGKNIHSLIHHTRIDGSPYPESECTIRCSVTEGKSGHSSDDIHWRADGTSFPVEWWSHPIVVNDKIVGGVVTFLNITERKATEKEIQLYREHLEKLLKERTETIQKQHHIINQIHDSVISTDQNHLITSWNTGAQKMYGYTAEYAIGKHISLLHPDDGQGSYLSGINKVLEENGSFVAEVVRKRKSGELFYAHLSLSQRYDEAGNPSGSIGLTVDITKRKEEEAETNRKSLELVAINKELEAFSYSVSHDLRAPLRTINGFGKILMEDHAHQLDSEGKNLLTRIINGTVRMSQLIDDLLQLSRVSRRNFNPQTVDISAIAQSTIDTLRNEQAGRQVRIQIQPGMEASGDKGLLEIALTNLLGNAWKYTNKTEHAEIDFGQFIDDNETIYYIKDNGAGFDMAYADKLFGTFQRLHAKDEFPGTGIGLATVQRIIHRHGGRIWAQSEPGSGATFFFTLSYY